MNDKNKISKKDEIDLEDLKSYAAMPAKEKLRHLEEMNKFLFRMMPEKSKRKWEALKKSGF